MHREDGIGDAGHDARAPREDRQHNSAEPRENQAIDEARRANLRRVSVEDRVWFQAHPSREYRLRCAAPDEYPGEHGKLWSVVRKIGPGRRYTFGFRAVAPCDDRDCDAELAPIWSWLFTEQDLAGALADVRRDARMNAVAVDADQIGRFVRALFVYASEGGCVSLRAFYDDALAGQRNERPYKVGAHRLNGDGLGALVDRAFALAIEAAECDRPVVLCPPIATFKGRGAKEKDLLEGLCLSVEIDEHAQAAVAKLRAILGGPTLLVASGGMWTDPETGEVQPKLHAHWRLNEPTQTDAEHRRLKFARTLACDLVQADASSKTVVHPIRWAGTVHRKGEPRLSTIVEENADSEISLEHVIAEMEGLVAAAGPHANNGHRPQAASPFRAVNDAAMAAFDLWVPALFGANARRTAEGIWRVPSSALGRELQEDISISPDGIVDFGVHDLGDQKRGKRTAIDLVIEHGGAADATAAAHWLAGLLGIEIEISAKSKPDVEPEAVGWSEQLHRNGGGQVRDILHNVGLILRSDARFKGHIRWNQMLEAVEAQGLPWRGGGWQPWTDADDTFLADWCQKRQAYVKPSTCAAAAQIVARDNCHHPVRDRLGSLVWDGTPRIDCWLSTYIGVADSPYARAVGRAWLIQAVARAFEPGCKADCCLIFEGDQDIGKSTVAEILAIERAWFSDEIADLGTKDAAQDLRGKWVIEIAELSAMNRSAVERTKAFLSRRVDHYRPSYGIRSQDFPRECVFVGSTNHHSYLADETGGRRFWPVKIGTIDLAGLKQSVLSLWAEAVTAYRAGAKWWLDNDAKAHARAEQEDRRIADPWEEIVLDWALSKPDGVSIKEAMTLALGIEYDRRDQHAQNRLVRIFRAAGWLRRRDPTGTVRPWRYFRPSLNPAPTAEEVERAAIADRFTAAPMRFVPDLGGPVPDCEAQSGTEKTSNFAARPSRPSRPGCFSKHMGLRHNNVAGMGIHDSGLRILGQKETTGTTGTTGTDAPAWDDLNHWQQQLGQAGNSLDARVSVVLAWGRAAGGKVTTSGETVRLSLPLLEHTYAAGELKRLARGLGLMSAVVFEPKQGAA